MRWRSSRLLEGGGIAAKPLRGLDAKLASTTEEADRFYRERLPSTDSEVAAELGALTKKEPCGWWERSMFRRQCWRVRRAS